MIDQTEGLRIGSLCLPTEYEELVVCRVHPNVKVSVLQNNTGHPLLWVHDNYDGVHLERSVANIYVEELQIRDGSQRPPVLSWSR